MIKCFMFDIGGVIVEFANSMYYDYLNEISGKDRESIDRIVDPLLARMEIGIISRDQFESVIARRLRIQKKQVQWKQFYYNTMRVDSSMLKLIEKLHKKYTTAFLSNIDKSHHTYTLRRINPGIFDFGFESFSLRLRKPDPEVYKQVLDSMGLEPHETVFIDDKKENIYTAKMVGLHGIHYVGMTDLKKKISRFTKG